MQLKKQYNDAALHGRGGPPGQKLLSGDTWYSQQAFRCLNQVRASGFRVSRFCRLGVCVFLVPVVLLVPGEVHVVLTSGLTAPQSGEERDQAAEQGFLHRFSMFL